MKRLALLLPIWLVFAIGEPSMVHPCATHGVAAQASAGHASSSVAHAHHATPAQPAEHSHTGCSCIGCCAPTTPVVLSPVTSLPAPTIALRDSALPTARDDAARFDVDLLLPYGNGPPA